MTVVSHLQDEGVLGLPRERITVRGIDLVQRIPARPNVRQAKILVGVAHA